MYQTKKTPPPSPSFFRWLTQTCANLSQWLSHKKGNTEQCMYNSIAFSQLQSLTLPHNVLRSHGLHSYGFLHIFCRPVPSQQMSRLHSGSTVYVCVCVWLCCVSHVLVRIVKWCCLSRVLHSKTFVYVCVWNLGWTHCVYYMFLNKLFWQPLCVFCLSTCRTRAVTLINFALSKHLVRESDPLTDQRGSLAYVSPDVLSGRQPLPLTCHTSLSRYINSFQGKIKY